MSQSRLVSRNVKGLRGRTSMRLEPELWDALEEICRRERTTLATLVGRIAVPAGGRTSAVRVGILRYYRAAATDAGHLTAGHGDLLRPAEPGRPAVAAARLRVVDGQRDHPG